MYKGAQDPQTEIVKKMFHPQKIRMINIPPDRASKFQSLDVSFQQLSPSKIILSRNSKKHRHANMKQ